MIELVSASRCIECNLCVKVCPTNVFEEVDGGVPVIARPDDCQTCFMCEAYCPVDALYVSPFAEKHITVDEGEIADRGLLGGYREDIGWGPGRTSAARNSLAPMMRALQTQMRITPQAAPPINQNQE